MVKFGELYVFIVSIFGVINDYTPYRISMAMIFQLSTILIYDEVRLLRRTSISSKTDVVIDEMFFSVDVVSQTDEACSEFEMIQSPVVILVEMIKGTLHFLDLLLVDSFAVTH